MKVLNKICSYAKRVTLEKETPAAIGVRNRVRTLEICLEIYVQKVEYIASGIQKIVWRARFLRYVLLV